VDISDRCRRRFGLQARGPDMTGSKSRAVPSRLASLLVLVALSSGCGATVADGVPEIIEGRSVCDECGMTIDDIRLAAAWRLPDGTSKVFDDIGGMLVNGEEVGDLDSKGRWVFDHDTGDAVPVAEASFVASGKLVTPMGWGVVAYARQKDAEAWATSLDGHVLNWEGLVASYQGGQLGMHDHDMNHKEGNTTQ